MVQGFRIGDYCVYRTHGVGKIISIEQITIGDFESRCYVVYFEREKLKLMVPIKYKNTNDIRKICSEEDMEKVFNILKSGHRKMKGMWSRRAKEYEEKINSGDLFQIAEVLQDLIRDVDDTDRSFSERIIYESALYRVASEYSVLKKIPYEEAEKVIIDVAKEKISFVNISELSTQQRIG